ncbi:MAG TPA: glycoside hydrolase family 97 protein [Prolixibacteraceae bacterium]|nr:glycoside hydrolase family 97 protein [Prolixibacteraceae bacterium]
MKFRSNFILIVILLFSGAGFAQNSIQVISPNGDIKFSLELTKNIPVYKVSFKKQELINHSSISLDFDNGPFGENLKINKPITKSIDETYDLVVGKTKHVRNYYKEITIPLEEKAQPFRKLNLVVRAYNDGVAFRYEFPKQKSWSSFVMYDENSMFNLQGNPRVLTLFLPSYTSSHEGKYTYLNYDEIQDDKLMDMPTLFEFPNKVYLAITDAALVDYAGMYLAKDNGILRAKLSPLPGQDKIKVKADVPHRSPWRVMMISDRMGALLESNIITNLNEPCAIEDVSWIKPLKTTFPWWNGTIVPDTTFAPGNNFETNKYYIDFCAANGIGAHSVVEYGLHEWYENDGYGFMPGPHVDVTKPLPGLDMKAICDYGKSKGVDIRVWVHWAALYPKIDEAFALFEKWGLTGMMVDFMDRDDQEMIQIQEEILQKAAKHHLNIQFHGVAKPTGLHRTYPNEFTREGTLNYECFKWGNATSADHDISMPFTRLLAGATDYHLGGFRALPESKFKVQQTRPYVTSTRCHMLAMYVVLESYLGMVCDFPEAYKGQAGFEFIREVPTVWDEIKVPYAVVNESVIVARRKNKDWYVGSINNSKERQLTLPLTFLGEGKYMMEIYTDSSDVDVNPNHLIKQSRLVIKSDVIDLSLASNGGAAMRFVLQK